MGRVITLELASVTPLLNRTIRLHWSRRRKKRLALAWEVKVAAMGNIPAVPFARARVSVIRRSVGTPDHDGFVGGLKDLLDVLQPHHEKRRPYGLGLIANDNPGCLVLEPVAKRVGARVYQGTTVIIEEL